MKVCIEGPNGVGKTYFILGVMAKLRNYNIDSSYVKLKPKKLFRIMTDDDNVFKRRMFVGSQGSIAQSQVDELINTFLSELHKAKDTPGEVVFFDRGILSTYIYGFVTYHYVTNEIKNFRDMNIFKEYIKTPYKVNGKILNHMYLSFVESINKALKVEEDKHRMDMTICLGPSSLSSKRYYENLKHRNLTDSSRVTTIYESEESNFNHIKRIFRDYMFLDKKTRKLNPFTQKYLSVCGDRLNYKIKNDFENMNLCIDDTVEQILKNITKYELTRRQ